MMTEEHSAMAMNSICNAASMVSYHSEVLSGYMTSPFILLKPRIFPDGNQWCALYGDNIQEGVAGFGDTPAKAQTDFDKNWLNQKLGNTANVVTP